MTQLEGWECPEPTPRKKKDSASETSSDAGSEKKARKPQSEETKAAAAIKRAATKAAKAVATASASAEAEPVALKESAPPSPVKVKAVNPDALKFNSWSYEGEDCWQNDRGDSLNPEGEWMGRMVKGKMTMTAQSEMPGDLEPFIQELME